MLLFLKQNDAGPNPVNSIMNKRIAKVLTEETLLHEKQMIKILSEEFPNEDWKNVPDPETLPDVFMVHYKRGETSCNIDHEYKTFEEANAQVEKCKTWENVHSVTVVAEKPFDAVIKFCYAPKMIERVKNGS